MKDEEHAPGISRHVLACSSILVVVSVITGPTVKFVRFLAVARCLNFSSRPDSFQFSCMNMTLCAEHFWPLQAYASWSHCQAT